jgi:hypothetical protein
LARRTTCARPGAIDLFMRIILDILQILLVIVAAVVVVSYIIRQYEIGNRAHGVPDEEKASTGEVILGIILEIGAVFISILLYPLGLIARDVPYSTLRNGERPIILCHGYMHNKSAFLVMGHRLKQMGRTNVIAVNFGPFSQEVPHFAERLSEAVSLALVHTGCDRADLIGHSMGGLVVRYYVEKLGGAASVDTAVTIGAPHRGTKMAALGLFKSSRQFRPDSPLITGFEESSSSGAGADMRAIWSDFDSVVLPREAACLPEPYVNVRIGGVGHVTMLFSNRVFNEVRRALTEKTA